MEADSGLVHIFSSYCQLLLGTSIDNEEKKNVVKNPRHWRTGLQKLFTNFSRDHRQEDCKGDETREPPKQAQWEREADDKHDGLS